MSLPDRYALAHDSAFATSGQLKDKIFKLKEVILEDREKHTEKEMSLTHSRKLA